MKNEPFGYATGKRKSKERAGPSPVPTETGAPKQHPALEGVSVYPAENKRQKVIVHRNPWAVSDARMSDMDFGHNLGWGD